MGFGMSDFNLKKALSGEKVITNNGDEVTQLTMMTVLSRNKLVGVCKDEVLLWYTSGASIRGSDHNDLHLKMAPDMGSGFLYVYDDGMSVVYKEEKDWFATPVMIFDLSDYPIGFGLEKEGK
tara:strand:- start:166 stop:531 length:366 start_codon:yes stop_codon:yes gene_type:complete